MIPSAATNAGRQTAQPHVMRIVRAGALYFALVFGAGLALGALRVLWVVPRLRERTAELMEAPIMFVVIVLAARWVTRGCALAAAPATRLAIGLVALGLMLVAEFTAVLWMRGMTRPGTRRLSGPSRPGFIDDHGEVPSGKSVQVSTQ